MLTALKSTYRTIVIAIGYVSVFLASFLSGYTTYHILGITGRTAIPVQEICCFIVAAFMTWFFSGLIPAQRPKRKGKLCDVLPPL